MTEMILTRLGYWRGAGSPDWPHPRLFVDPEWDDDERDDVASYLSRGFVARAYMGLSMCRLCSQSVGSLELTDGTYLWPEGLSHYVAAHRVRLPARIIDHIRLRTIDFEDAVVDEAWWRSEAPR